MLVNSISFQDVSSFLQELRSFLSQDVCDNNDSAEEVREELKENHISSIREQINKEREEAKIEHKERKTMQLYYKVDDPQ